LQATDAKTGGAASYDSSSSLKTTFRRATKLSAGIKEMTKRSFGQFLLAGGEFPSCYYLSGHGAWSHFYPSAYAPTPDAEGIEELAVDPQPIEIKLQGQAA
jgi:hypothetical protein